MGLKEYKIVDHYGRESTVQLNDEDAKLQGLKASDEVKAKETPNKQATPANKSASSDKRAEAASKAYGGSK